MLGILPLQISIAKCVRLAHVCRILCRSNTNLRVWTCGPPVDVQPQAGLVNSHLDNPAAAHCSFSPKYSIDRESVSCTAWQWVVCGASNIRADRYKSLILSVFHDRTLKMSIQSIMLDAFRLHTSQVSLRWS